MVKIDMWHNDNVKNVTKLDVTFYDLDCEYRGNLYINNKIVGDFVADDSVELEETFHWLHFNW